MGARKHWLGVEKNPSLIFLRIPFIGELEETGGVY